MSLTQIAIYEKPLSGDLLADAMKYDLCAEGTEAVVIYFDGPDRSDIHYVAFQSHGITGNAHVQM